MVAGFHQAIVNVHKDQPCINLDFFSVRRADINLNLDERTMRNLYCYADDKNHSTLNRLT